MNGKNSVFFIKDGKIKILDIIDRQFDLKSIIGKETKKAILKLMTKLETERKYKLYNPNAKKIIDEKGREYISFNEPDFHDAVDLFKNNPISFGGLLYVIEVIDHQYLGLTERTLNVRFNEHILDALRFHFITGGDLNKKGYHKFYNAICSILKHCFGDINKLHQQLETYSALGQLNKRQVKIDEIKKAVNPYIKPHIIELHYGKLSLSKRESVLIEKFPLKELLEKHIIELIIKDSSISNFISLRTQGLNTAAGGAGVSISLPLYDIAIMIALGFSGRKISKILQIEYELFTSYNKVHFKGTIQHKILDIFGGIYKAQEELLVPIIETLDDHKFITRHEIYLAFKHSEKINAWFVDWSYGRIPLKRDINLIIEKYGLDPNSDWDIFQEHLEIGERYYAGIPECTWIKWLINRLPREKKSRVQGGTIEGLVQVGGRKVDNIYIEIAKKYGVSNRDELRVVIHCKLAKEILLKGYIETDKGITMLNPDTFHRIIYTDVMFYARPDRAKQYFENILFKGITLEEIWKTFRIKEIIKYFKE